MMWFIPRTSTLFNGVMLKQSGEIDIGAGNRSCNLSLDIQQNNNLSFETEILFLQSQNKDSTIELHRRLLVKEQTRPLS